MNDHNRPVTGYPAASVANSNGYGGAAQPSGTAYPYAAPPASSAAYYTNNPYYQHQQPQPYTTQRVTLLRRVIAVGIAAMVITGSIFFIIWLILRPKLPEFQVDSLSISNLNLSNSLISANWDLRFTVRNPNKKMTLYYDDIAAAVFYDSVTLADTTVPPFFLDKRAETGQKASFATSSSYVETRAFDGMNKERAQSGSIGFNVNMVARVRFNAGAWRTRRRYLRVLCKGLSVGVGADKSSGNLRGGPRQCKIAI